MGLVIVVDTNALWVNDSVAYDEGSHWKTVLDLARADGYGTEIVVPDVVVREHAQHEAAAISKARRETEKALRTVVNRAPRAGLTISVPDPDAMHEVVLPRRDEIAATMRSQLRAAGVKIADLPDISHSTLVDWSLDRHPPFDQSDKGYRDALLWLTVCRVAAGSGRDVLFVTNDKDFRQHGSLHPHLKASFETTAPDSTITLVEELSEAVKHRNTRTEASAEADDEDAEEGGAEAEARDEFDGEDVSQFFASKRDILRSALPGGLDRLIGTEISRHYDRHQAGSDLSLPGQVENAQIESIEPDLDALWIDTHENLDGDTTLGSAIFPAEVHYDGFVHKADQFDGDPAWVVIDPDWNERYVLVSGSIEVEMEFNFIISGEELESLDLMSISPR